MARHPPRRTARDLTLHDIQSIMAQADNGKNPVDIAVDEGLTPGAVKRVIRKARAALANNAERYAELHAATVETAFANGDPKSLAVAIKGTQWALERISDGEDRVLDPVPRTLETGPKEAPSFKLGIIVGGVPQGPLPAIAAGSPEPSELPAHTTDAKEAELVNDLAP
jgi:hypothetical protein